MCSASHWIHALLLLIEKKSIYSVNFYNEIQAIRAVLLCLMFGDRWPTEAIISSSLLIVTEANKHQKKQNNWLK